jgi:hypothetical protein
VKKISGRRSTDRRVDKRSAIHRLLSIAEGARQGWIREVGPADGATLIRPTKPADFFIVRGADSLCMKVSVKYLRCRER